MEETLRNWGNIVWAWATSPATPFTFSVILVACVVLLVCVKYYLDPNRKESAMARRREREKVAEMITKALDDALLKNELTPQQRQRYFKRLGKALDLPDLIPRRTLKLKELIINRLALMGTDISSGLDKIRRRRTNKKQKVRAALRNKSA